MMPTTDVLAGAVDALTAGASDHGERITELEEWKAFTADQVHAMDRTVSEDHLALDALLERVDYLESERKSADTDRYVELRRIIKIIGLTEVLAAET